MQLLFLEKKIRTQGRMHVELCAFQFSDELKHYKAL